MARGTERARNARALERVESARRVAGGVGGDAVALDDGGPDAGLGEVVGHGAARRSSAYYYNILDLGHGSGYFLLWNPGGFESLDKV